MFRRTHIDKKKITAFIFIAVIIVAVGIAVARLPQKTIACTLEAKICPDGTVVVRVGPHCEFALCPGESR